MDGFRVFPLVDGSRRWVVGLVAGLLLGAWTAPLTAQSLGGSTRSMDTQNRIAEAHDFTFLRSANEVQRFVTSGRLVRLTATPDFYLKAVSFPYARPEVKLFVQRLAAQYQRACGERLVVTSLTRPQERQPRNASSRSVHPTGMAVDLRRSTSPACRSWLEDTLLYLEGQKVLEATRERRPPHYHVAVFPQSYARYVANIGSKSDTRVAEAGAGEREHRVRSGDSLWSIARQYGSSIDSIRAANQLRGSRIYAGQRLVVPAR